MANSTCVSSADSYSLIHFYHLTQHTSVVRHPFWSPAPRPFHCATSHRILIVLVCGAIPPTLFIQGFCLPFMSLQHIYYTDTAIYSAHPLLCLYRLSSEHLPDNFNKLIKYFVGDDVLFSLFFPFLSTLRCLLLVCDRFNKLSD